MFSALDRDYKGALREASRLLTRVLSLNSLLRLIAKTIADSIGATSVTIFLLREDGSFWAVCNETSRPETSPPLVLPDSIQRTLTEFKKPVILDAAGDTSRHTVLGLSLTKFYLSGRLR